MELSKVTMTGAAWVKGDYDRLYDQVKGGKRTVCYVDYNAFGVDMAYRDICTIKPETMEFTSRGHGYGTAKYSSGVEKELFIQLCESINVEWLCDGTAAGREEDAVEFVNWLHLNAMKASWDTGQLTNKWIHKDDAYTTAQLYELFKQKEK